MRYAVCDSSIRGRAAQPATASMRRNWRAGAVRGGREDPAAASSGADRTCSSFDAAARCCAAGAIAHSASICGIPRNRSRMPRRWSTRRALPSEPPAPPAASPSLASPCAMPRRRRKIPARGRLPWLQQRPRGDDLVDARISHRKATWSPRSATMIRPSRTAVDSSQPLLRRPLDIAFVALNLQRTFGCADHLIDPATHRIDRLLHGRLRRIDRGRCKPRPEGPPTQMIPGGLLLPSRAWRYPRVLLLKSKGCARWWRFRPPAAARSPPGEATGCISISVPLLLIAGDRDHTVSYASGARAFFDQAVNAPLYLLTFEGAVHSIGLSPAPSMHAQASVG